MSITTPSVTPALLSELNRALINAKNTDETKLLISAGADVNAKNEYGDTALKRAKYVEQTRLLHEAGAVS